MMIRRARISFDQLVWLSLTTVMLLLAAVIVRGDQLQLQPIRLVPAPETTGISTRAQVQIYFDQPVAVPPTGVTLRLEPAVAGELTVDSDRLTFTPQNALAAYTTYRVELEADLRGRQGGHLQEPIAWEFSTGGVQVVYTAVDPEGKERLYITDAQLTTPTKAPAAAQQLTHGPLNVWDFSVSPVGGEIIYSALKEDGSSDLWRLQPGGVAPTLFVPCPNAVCSSSAWSLDGKLLAYARRNASEFGAATLSPPRLWLFDPATGESLPLFNDNQTLAFEPSWSADSAWISYVSPNDGGVGVVHLERGETHFYPTISGESAQWHPTQTRFLYTLFQQQNEQFVAHLIEVDPVSGETHNLSGEQALVEDGAPAWSPDGSWIALRRKMLAGPDSTPGKQI
ncbi:MAG: Ig-like domain-containing protein, partial [Caldilineaceae bacterium]|nr:Ig-like domain-containing protein [Caldilineaceae bacterium]